MKNYIRECYENQTHTILNEQHGHCQVIKVNPQPSCVCRLYPVGRGKEIGGSLWTVNGHYQVLSYPAPGQHACQSCPIMMICILLIVPYPGVYSTAWSTNTLSSCCWPMTKEYRPNWQIINMSVMPFLSLAGSMHLTCLCSKQSN